jgi:hypothetical protein
VSDKSDSTEQPDFSEIVKNAYEKGITETGMTVAKLIEDLKIDLKKMMVS